MQSRRLLSILTVTTIVVFSEALLAADPPNVLLIMADDLRDFGGVFTPELVKTPNLDRLRARGTTFQRAYIQYPVCNPSRCSMLTGLRPEQTRIIGNDTPLRERAPSAVTIPQLLKDNGWYTAAFGKIFHLGGGNNTEQQAAWADTQNSWHEARAFQATRAGRELVMGRNVTDGALKWCAWGAAAGTDDDQPDGQIAQATIECIRKQRGKPWFVGCGFMKPHDPFIAPQKYFALYPLESLTPWSDPANISTPPTHAVGFGDYGKAFKKFSDQEWRELLRAYCAGTTFMDAQLGRVLDELDRQDLWKSTIVIFVGDHGYHTGERGWWNKNTLYERSCRAPLIVAAPGMPAGKTTRSLVEFVDLYPTIADLCRLRAPSELPGVSLTPVLSNSESRVKDAAFTLVTRGPKLHGQAVRTEQYRFIQWSDGSRELYDCRRDPEEFQNLAEQRPELVSELASKLQSLPNYSSQP